MSREQKTEQCWVARFKEAWGRPSLDGMAKARLDAAVRARLERRPVGPWRLAVVSAASIAAATAAVFWLIQPAPPTADEAALLLDILGEAQVAVEVATDWDQEVEEVWYLGAWVTASSTASAGPTAVVATNGEVTAAETSGQAKIDEAAWPDDYQGLAIWLGFDLWS